jgi:CRP-like cAMP-binding protein
MGVLAEEAGISEATREILAEEDFTEIVTYDKETILIKQGDRPDALYFTIDGIFHAISSANAQAGNRLLGRVEAGQFLGELSLVDPSSQASATVKAFPHAMVLKMKPKSFDDFIEAHPKAANEFLLAVARQLAKRLREANERIL